MAEGWEGWDEYAPFYDWENAQTVGRRDVRFWKRLARATEGPVLELGCGTGRVTFPLAREGVSMVGIDRSAEMLARAERRRRRTRRRSRIQLVRGDIRRLPFHDHAFALAIAPYGILQSLLRERDLATTLDAVARVLSPGATFGLELVADLPSWKEYSKRVSLRGRRANGTHVTLVESVRQDPARKLTLFDQEFVERAGGGERRRRFRLAFRTLTVQQMTRRLEKAGLGVTALLGDYQGGPWDPRAEAWIILATKPRAGHLGAGTRHLAPPRQNGKL
ncbi:MAG: class I SAM-dependent methyltransferase [Vicinamibacterales bacterium]